MDQEERYFFVKEIDNSLTGQCLRRRLLASLSHFDIIQMNRNVALAIFLLIILVKAQNTQTQGCLVQEIGSLRCQVCNSSLQLDNQGNCNLYTPIEGCKVYSSQSGNGCFACQTGFLLQGGVCLAMLPNCIQAVTVSTCDQCAQNYTLVRFSNCYSTDVSNCSLGSLPRTVNGVSYCQVFSNLNCDFPSNDNSFCNTCNRGYTLINGICFLVRSAIQCAGNSCGCQGFYFNNTCYSVQISNCLQSRDGIYCDLCGDNSYASKGACFNFTKADDINCNLLTLDRTRCSACNLNYVLNADFICVRDFGLCPKGCTSCPATFNLYQGNCLPSDPLCRIYNFTRQTCVLCQEGYSLDVRTLVCTKTVTCLTTDQAGICSACFSGYQLDPQTRRCIALPPNCLVMNITSGFCANCSTVTSLSSSGCIFPTTNCTSYNFFGRCQTCAEGFVQVRRSCLPIASNCQVFGSDQSICVTCNQGFILFGGVCSLSIEGCLSYAQRNQCAQCSTNYQLINGNCFWNDANCLAQDTNGLCLGCRSGYLPSKGRCVYYDPYCLDYDFSTLSCRTAFSNFGLGRFSFQQKLAYTDFVQRAQAASRASINSDFAGGSGQGSFNRNGIISELPYAGLTSESIARYSANGNILACRNGYSLSNRAVCVRTISNCFEYDQYSNCVTCNPGYDILFDGSCALRSSATCQTQTGGICVAAAANFVLVNGAAVSAGRNVARSSAQGLVVSAQSGYFVWKERNLAWPLDYNCISQFVPGTCLSCSVGFSLWNGRCVVQKMNCVAYSRLGLCMGCSQGFLLWMGECRQSNCASVDPSFSLCSRCNSPFTNSLGICLPPALNWCQVYSGSSCFYCIQGYYLAISGICSKMINNCLTANPQTGRCTSCITNYTYYNEQCIPRINNCDIYSQDLTSCTTCLQLFFPINNGKQCGSLGMFCLALADARNCAQCRPGFNLITQNNTNMCVRPIANCFWYDARANCLICNTGYVLQFNACKSIRCSNFIPPQSRCNSCISPFILLNNFCVDPNCNRTVGEVCIQCLPRYYLRNGLCVLIDDKNCEQVAINGTCLRCITGFKLNITTGLCVSTDDLYNGCQRQENPCTKCALGYELRQGLCWARKCAVYKSNRDCQTCIFYYDLEPTQRFCILYTCASPSCYLIDNPPDGFYIDASGNLNITYCTSFNGPNCLSCSNYRFPNPGVRFGLCYPYNCKTNIILNCTGNCLQYYTNVPIFPGSCLADNCARYDDSGKCLACLSNYNLQNGICILIQIDNCAIIDYANRICTLCNNGYEVWNGICRVANCGIFGSDNLTCRTCSRGYQLVGGICQPAKCSKVSGQICQECLPGFYLQNGLCYARNCLQFDQASMVCTSCSSSFELIAAFGICKPSNCRTYDSTISFCENCIDGFLLQNGLCISADPNCISFDSLGNCQACRNQMVAVGSRCITRIPGCLNYNTAGCSSCQSPYDLRNGICHAKYCQNASTPDFCITCLNRYETQSNGTCRPKNCLEFDQNQWACTACESRFQLISPFCFTYNCSTYSQTRDQCQTCQPGFVLLQDTCTFANCLSPYQFACANCLPGFNLVGGICRAPENNCDRYDFQRFLCLQCRQGFNLSAFGICISSFVDPFCVLTEPNSGRCLQCLPSFSYNPNSQQCESNFCRQFNPSTAQRGRVCASCLPGFILDSSQRYCIAIYCLSYDLSTSNCWTCAGGSTLRSNVCYANNCNSYSSLYPLSPVCQTCSSGYQLNTNSLCVPMNCASLNLDLTCATCSPNFALSSNGLCVPNNCQSGFVFNSGQCTPANCQFYNRTAGGCTTCLPGFVQEGRFCVAQGCIQYDSSYMCLQCASGYTLNTVNGQVLCVLTIQPVCPNGFYLTSQTCRVIPIGNCSISDNSGQTCYRCMDGYLLRNNICYLIDGCLWPSFISGCRNCLPGFVLNGFLCVSLNCLDIFSNNTCRSCRNGFILRDGVCIRNIYQCLRIDTNGNCAQCAENFRLNNGICIAIGCVSYSPTTFVCLQCDRGYVLNSAKQICQLQITIPNCFTPLNATFCQLCNNGYLQLNGNCFIMINWCLDYNNSTGLCIRCSAGYYVNQQGSCVPLPSFCLSAITNGQCITCVQGYRVFVGQCLPNIQFCQAFNSSTGLCRQCQQGYYLTTEGNCQLLPGTCTAALPSGACTSCRTSYTLVSGVCTATIAFCFVYNPSNPAYCFQCVRGYYLNAIYTCTILPPFCQNANSLGVCLNCITGYQLVNSICIVPVPNCISYVQLSSSSRCSICAPGFNLTPNFTCSQLPPYCQSGSANVCTNCIDGYRLFQNICVVMVSNCISWSSTSLQCTNCNSGFYLSLNSIGSYLCSSLPRFCLRADIFGSCLECLQGYIIYNQQCVDNSTIRFCRVYNLTTFTCVQCISGYQLNSNSRCIPSNCQNINNQGQCIGCLPSYILVGEICLIQIANCMTYNQNTGLCIRCGNGYTLSFDGRSCNGGDPFCNSYNIGGVCIGCINGYYLNQGICRTLPIGCISAGNNGLCLTCLPQFILINGGICVLRIDNCNIYSSNGCTQCISQYYLRSNQCWPFPIGCLSYDTNLQRCLSCASDYVLNTTTWICFRRSQNCVQRNGQNQCIYCPNRFFLSNGNCLPYPDYCVTVDFLGNCISCAFGSQLSGSGCIPTDGRRLNCITYDSVRSICITCAQGYSLCPATGICVMPDPGCQNFTFNGDCLVCKAAYVLYQGRCLLYPPGVVVLPNGAISCISGYTLQNNSCLRNQNTLTMASALGSACRFSYSSGSIAQPPYIGSSFFWSPSQLQINQFLSVSFTNSRPQAIFQIGVKGSQQGWVSGYVVQFKNRADAPWICWNGCNMIVGNSDGSSTSWLKMYHPIVATELRVYPVGWVGALSLQVDLWVLHFS